MCISSAESSRALNLSGEHAKSRDADVSPVHQHGSPIAAVFAGRTCKQATLSGHAHLYALQCSILYLHSAWKQCRRVYRSAPVTCILEAACAVAVSKGTQRPKSTSVFDASSVCFQSALECRLPLNVMSSTYGLFDQDLWSAHGCQASRVCFLNHGKLLSDTSFITVI